MPGTILPLTKFLIPPIPKDAIVRERLIQKLNLGVQQRLVMISAPAGFGKSTLTAQWQAQTGQPVAWLTLDREDNNPTNFANSLLSVLSLRFEPQVVEGTALPDLLTPLPIEEIENRLNRLLLNNPLEMVIVLDDYHHIETLAIHQRLCDLMQAAPPQTHFLIASRTRPPLSVNCFRVRRQLLELGPNDLRFNQEEIQEFFRRTVGIDLAEQDLNNMRRRSEGWAACLQLAALSMQNMNSAEAHHYIETFTSSSRHVWDYLIEEVYSRQPEPIQVFMQQTSILRRLSAPLCDEVTGGTNSREFLDYLDRSNLVTPLEDKRRWYRYPALIADFLYEMLEQRRGIAGTFEFHRRAAHWYESIGELGEAAHHALAALDNDYSNLLLNRIQRSVNLGDYAAWQYSFLDLPDEILREQPDACYNCAVSLILSNDLVNYERPLKIAEQVWQAQGNPAKLGMVYHMRALIKRFEGDNPAAVELAQKALECLAPEDTLSRAGSEHILAMAQYQLGRVRLAEEMLPEAIRVMREQGEYYSAEMAEAGLARVQMASGKLRLAEKTYQTVVAFTDGKVYDQVLSGHVFLGAIYYEWNRLDLAEQHLRQAFAEPAGRVGRYWPLAHIYLALIAATHDEFTKAEDELRQARAAAETFKKLGWRRMVKSFAAWLALRAGDPAAARRLLDELAPLKEDDLDYYPRFNDWLVEIRLLTAQGRSEKEPRLLQKAAELAERLQAEAEEDGRGQDLARLLTLKAIALWHQNEHAQALAVLSRAFDLAEPEGFMRTFLDEGEAFSDLLTAALARDVHAIYAGRLQAELHPASELYLTVGVPPQPVGLLSPREAEILRAIAKGMTTQEIAEQYFLSVFTVRTHVKRIFEKLDAHSRLQAVEHARARGLI